MVTDSALTAEATSAPNAGTSAEGRQSWSRQTSVNCRTDRILAKSGSPKMMLERSTRLDSRRPFPDLVQTGNAFRLILKFEEFGRGSF
jgi:hypothetical protein